MSVANLQTISPEDPAYPEALKTCAAFKTAPPLTAIGSLNLLQSPGVALFCSKQCPGDLILKTYDLVQALRKAGVLVISGFHTPIEQDCLKILQRGSQGIIYCPARSIHTLRLSSDQKQAVRENRLLILSPFRAGNARMTAKLAEKRNELVAAIAHTIVIAYAAPDSKTLSLARRLIQTGKSVVTLNHSTTEQMPSIPDLGIDAIARLVTPQA